MNEPRPSERILYCKWRTRRAWERGYPTPMSTSDFYPSNVIHMLNDSRPSLILLLFCSCVSSTTVASYEMVLCWSHCPRQIPAKKNFHVRILTKDLNPVFFPNLNTYSKPNLLFDKHWTMFTCMLLSAYASISTWKKWVPCHIWCMLHLMITQLIYELISECT